MGANPNRRMAAAKVGLILPETERQMNVAQRAGAICVRGPASGSDRADSLWITGTTSSTAMRAKNRADMWECCHSSRRWGDHRKQEIDAGPVPPPTFRILRYGQMATRRGDQRRTA